MAVVKREISERIATLRLNRPEAKNAINKDVHLAPVSYTHLTLPTTPYV